jgi:hypothetical protein
LLPRIRGCSTRKRAMSARARRSMKKDMSRPIVPTNTQNGLNSRYHTCFS